MVSLHGKLAIDLLDILFIYGENKNHFSPSTKSKRQIKYKNLKKRKTVNEPK